MQLDYTARVCWSVQETVKEDDTSLISLITVETVSNPQLLTNADYTLLIGQMW